jgi:ABC-type multidrug transport system ATPase subunit
MYNLMTEGDMTLTKPMITLTGVSIRYPGKLALDSVSLTLNKGEMTTIVGSNGSGKSTLVKTLGGLCRVGDGERALAEPHKKLIIGYASDRFPKLKLTITEYLQHMGAIARMERQPLHRRIADLHRTFGLNPDSRTHIRHFSKGMLQKVNLMQAVLVQPDLLLLDEPLSGLDPVTMEELTEMLLDLKHEGVTIVAAAHEKELAETADRIVMISDGRLTGDYRRAAYTEPFIEIESRIADPSARSQLAKFAGVLHHKQIGTDDRFLTGIGQSDAFLQAVLASGGSIIRVSPIGGASQMIESHYRRYAK